MFAVFLNQSPQEKDDFSVSDTSGSEKSEYSKWKSNLEWFYLIRETYTNNQCKIATSKQRMTVE